MDNATFTQFYLAATGSKAKKLKSIKAAREEVADMPKRPSVRRALEAGVELAVDDLVELWPISRKYATDIFAKIRIIDEVAISKNDDGAFAAE